MYGSWLRVNSYIEIIGRSIIWFKLINGRIAIKNKFKIINDR